ncbi:MAG: signal transduction histidine kinase/CheY-like chemotaxis protein, partial [Gammaproteobacteria bacterium]
SFQGIDVASHPQFGTSHLIGVETDAAGELYAGTAEGAVLRLRGGQWSAIDIPCDCSGRVRAMEASPDGAMWIGAGCGLYRIAGGEDRAERVSAEHVTAIAATAEGEVFVGFLDGVHRVRPGPPQALGGLLARFLEVSSDGTLYAASREQIVRRDDDSWTQLPVDLEEIQCVQAGVGDDLWVTGIGGFGRWDCSLEEWVPDLTEVDCPAQVKFPSVFIDREGNTWVGTDTHGVFEFYRAALDVLIPVAGRSDGLVSATCTSDGRVFTLGKTLYEVCDGILVPSVLPPPSLMAPARDEGLWLNTSWGIERERDGERERVISRHELPRHTGALLEARDGTLWITGNGVLLAWDGHSLERTDLVSAGAGATSTALFEDSLGRIWVAGLSSLTIWDGSHPWVLHSGVELPLGEIRSLHETADGSVWLGTYGGGLCRIRGRAVDVLDTFRGLYENTATALVADGEGHLLVLGNRAVARYSLAELEAAASGGTELLRPRLFNSGPGIKIFEGNGALQPRVAVGPEGNIWFPCLHGLVRFDPSAVSDLGRPPRARVRCEVAPGSVRELNAEGKHAYRLEPDGRDVLIQFSAPSFLQPRQLTYRYRLNGRDTDWVISKHSDSVRFDNLAPGDYGFEIEAAVADGPFGPTNKSLLFRIPPTWLERLWVKRLLFLMLFAVVGGVTVFRLRVARRRGDALEGVVNRRTGELRNEISERKRIEEDLRRAGEDLEAQVGRRTEELAQALGTLEQDMREREQLEGRLRESEKLEVVGRLAGGLAHDFNNILTAVLGETDLALARLEENRCDVVLRPVLEEHLANVRTAGMRASRLTRQLLAYSRQQVMQPEVIDPLETLKSLRTMLARLVPDNVEITIREHPQSRPVLIDPGQLEQVIVNLVVNAAEAMPEGGSVELGCRVEVASGGETATVVSVTDSGVGLSPEIRDHIFEPFFSTKGQARGLGLASVQGIVMQSGGSLEVEESSSRGLTFHVGFPVTNERPKPIAASADDSLAEGIVALLIDDEVDVRRIARLMLERGGVQVVEAKTPSDALALARVHQADIDILVTDVVMPQMNGRELSRAVRELCPEIKVLFISGHFREELSERDLLDQNANFLGKPFEAAQLVNRVAELTRTIRTV